MRKLRRRHRGGRRAIAAATAAKGFPRIAKHGAATENALLVQLLLVLLVLLRTEHVILVLAKDTVLLLVQLHAPYAFLLLLLMLSFQPVFVGGNVLDGDTEHGWRSAKHRAVALYVADREAP